MVKSQQIPIYQSNLDKTTTHTLTLLLPVHNRGSTTAGFLQHFIKVLPTNINLKVVVFNDGCTDETVAMAKKAWPLTTVIELDGNAYWGGALNAVARYIQDEARTGANSDYYLLCNDDIRFPSQTNLVAGLEAVGERTLVCARGLLVDHAQITSSTKYDSRLERKASPGIHYNSSDGTFSPAMDKSCVNVASTWAMLTSQRPWLHAVNVPASIPHYLSDYWLTYNLNKLGFQIAHPDEFICMVSSKTTRNKPRPRSGNWRRQTLIRMKYYISKTSPEYAPAWITFYSQDHLAPTRLARAAKLWLILKFSESFFALLLKLDKRRQKILKCQ